MNGSTSTSMSLKDYLNRIGLDAPPADVEGLAQMQQAHRQAIAFENLDVMLGRPIPIDSESVFDKLVHRGRGGYCFEQNRLFSDMLVAMGMPNRPLLARVRLGPPEPVPPRTHVLLLVDMDGEPWIADAGFGGSLVPPLPLADGATAMTLDGARHRLRRIGETGALAGAWLLERAGPVAATDGRAAEHGDWQPQYTFDLSEVTREDLEQANHWTSTRANTRFTTLTIASIVLPDGFAALTDRQLTVYRNGETESRPLMDMGEYHKTVRELFGIDFSLKEVAGLPLFADAGS